MMIDDTLLVWQPYFPRNFYFPKENVGVWTLGPNQLGKLCCVPQIQMVMRVDTGDLSWFGQYKALLPAEGG
jgi:hypothetical protein